MGNKRRLGQAVIPPKHQCFDRFSYLRDGPLYLVKHQLSHTEYQLDCLNCTISSSAAVPHCPTSCSTCSAQYRPLHWQTNIEVSRYINQYSDAEASNAVQQHISSTNRQLKWIGDKLERHGNAILKRWMKRPVQKRSALLREAMPNMSRYRTSSPDFSKLCCGKLSDYRQALLLPYLNLELLSEEPMNLMALLHYRSTTPPSEWVMFDSAQLHDGFGQGSLEASYNPHCVTMFGDIETFGKLVPYDNVSAHRWEHIGFPRAELILEAQHTLADFLCRIIELLLGTGQEVPEGDHTWKASVASDFKQAVSSDAMFSYRSYAFCAAPRLSLKSMLASFEDRLQMARDESVLLQTDPSYARQLLATAENSSSQKHGCDCCGVPNLINLMENGLKKERRWRINTEQAKWVLELCQQHNVHFFAGEYVPKECLESIGELEFVLESDFEWFRMRARKLALELGVIDEHIRYDGEAEPGVVAKYAERDDPVFGLLNTMRPHYDSETRYPCYHLQALDYIVRTSTGSRKAKLNQPLVECIADMCTLDEAIMAIKYSRPYPAKDPTEGILTKARTRPRHGPEIYVNKIANRWRDFDSVLWPPLKEFMRTSTPSAKVHGRTLEHFDASHDALAAFWRVERQVRKQILKESDCPRELRKSIMEALAPSRSAEYEKERADTRQQLVKAIEEKAALEEERKKRAIAKPTLPSISNVQKVWGNESSPERSTSKVASKDKRRDSAVATTTSTQPSNGEVNVVTAGSNNVTTQQSTIAVSSRSYDIFHRMFVSWGKHASSNVRWNDFVQAMAEAGATATQASGSRITFRQAQGGGGALAVHWPHDNMINPIMMRAFGKRFARWHWDIDTFEERT